MLTWKAEGLPSDDLSVENAVVLLHTQQVPLVIDPSAQAAEWLREAPAGESGVHGSGERGESLEDECTARMKGGSKELDAKVLALLLHTCKQLIY